MRIDACNHQQNGMGAVNNAYRTWEGVRTVRHGFTWHLFTPSGFYEVVPVHYSRITGTCHVIGRSTFNGIKFASLADAVAYVCEHHGFIETTDETIRRAWSE